MLWLLSSLTEEQIPPLGGKELCSGGDQQELTALGYRLFGSNPSSLTGLPCYMVLIARILANQPRRGLGLHGYMEIIHDIKGLKDFE